MKISIMREFVTLAQIGNFTRAAEELYIAQSALSRHLNSLEEELGVRLVERDHNFFRLTKSGEIAREEFTRILMEYDRFLGRLNRVNEMEEGELRVGFLYYDRDLYAAKIRSEFHKEYPKILLEMISCQPREMEEMLFAGKTDIAIIYGAAGCRRDDIIVHSFLLIPYTLIFSQNHRFASMNEVRIEDLNGEKYLAPDRNLILNQVADHEAKMLKEHKVAFSGKVPISNYDEVPWLMEDTGAVYLAPMANPHAYGKNTAFVYLDPDNYEEDVSLVWLKQNSNPAIQRFLSVVRKCYP